MVVVNYYNVNKKFQFYYNLLLIIFKLKYEKMDFTNSEKFMNNIMLKVCTMHGINN